jgi:hypothetical protein
MRNIYDEAWKDALKEAKETEIRWATQNDVEAVEKSYEAARKRAEEVIR